MANSNSGLISAISELIQALTSLLPSRKVASKKKDTASSDTVSVAAAEKVARIWSGQDPNVISVTRCKKRVRRDWPTLAQALDELGVKDSGEEKSE